MAVDRITRHRLTIPASDSTVMDFISVQSNLSASVRMLIRDYVAKYGYTDVTCQRVEKNSKRGRPSKTDELEFEGEFRDNEQIVENATLKSGTTAPVTPKPENMTITPNTANIATNNNTENVVIDDDGFVDPATLLGL